MTMEDYEEYLEARKSFSTAAGYYEACDFLAFINNPWVEYNSYKKKIESAIKRAREINSRGLIGADFCCGRQMWVSRFFGKYFERIFCIDLDENSFKDLASLPTSSKPKVQIIATDASRVKLPQKVNFLYCGFNVYSRFIPNFINNLKRNGIVFLMKPKAGDDLTLRSEITGYDMAKRIKEIANITRLLKKNCRVVYSELVYHWVFPARQINKVLAGFSVVSMGSKDICLTKKQYIKSIRNLRNNVHNYTLVVSQTISLWEGIKLLQNSD